ncbi:hypothetical protein IFM89_001985, partial [Coptis chinensis]
NDYLALSSHASNNAEGYCTAKSGSGLYKQGVDLSYIPTALPLPIVAAAYEEHSQSDRCGRSSGNNFSQKSKLRPLAFAEILLTSGDHRYVTHNITLCLVCPHGNATQEIKACLDTPSRARAGCHSRHCVMLMACLGAPTKVIPPTYFGSSIKTHDKSDTICVITMCLWRTYVATPLKTSKRAFSTFRSAEDRQ